MSDSEYLAMADVSPFQGVHLHHVARETSDVNRMVEFYQQVCYRHCFHISDSGVLFVARSLLGSVYCSNCNLRREAPNTKALTACMLLRFSTNLKLDLYSTLHY